MSLYDRISKAVGSKARSIRYPSFDLAVETCSIAETKTDEGLQAFMQVLTWYRHLTAPETHQQEETIQYIAEQFSVLSNVYKEIP